MSTLEIDGRTLHYLEQGEGEALLWLHAFPLEAESHRLQLDGLSAKMRVIVPDLRGFGRSALGAVSPGSASSGAASSGTATVTSKGAASPAASRAASPATTMEQLAHDALALLDHLGLERAWIGGVSMGGYAAMALLRLAPPRVKGLILSDTHPDPDPEEGRAGREVLAQAVEREGTGVLIERLLPRLLGPNAEEAIRRDVSALIERAPVAGVAAASRGMALRGSSREVLARYAGPALVIVGEHDAITPFDKARSMAELLSDGSLVRIPEAGHLPHLEAPEAFNEVVEEFIGAWSSSSQA